MLRKLGIITCVILALGLLAPMVMAQDEEPFTLTIMHTNDEHSAHEPNSDGDGGAARQATVVGQIRDEIENTLLLDGGDRFTGTLFHVQYRGQSNAQIMNMLGYDAMTLGNHEFDDGDEVLAAFVDALEFPVVTANVDFSESPFLADKIDPYVVLDVGGEQVGIIGLVTPESEILASPGPELVFNYDLVDAAQGAVDELTEQGINKIILLTHIGYAADVEVAQAVTGVDVVVGGHTNTLLSNTYAGAVGEYPTVLENADGEPVLVVQASTRTLYLGRLDVQFDADGVLSDWGGDVVLLSRYITPDPDVSDLIAGLAEPIDELRNQPVGDAPSGINGEREQCRFEECQMGIVITDAFIAETGAQVALMNGGGIRASFDEGEVSLGEVINVLPFGNLISTLQLTGEDLADAIEHGVGRAESQENEGTGRFLQVGGLRYTADLTEEVGARVQSIEVLNEDGEYEPLDPEAIYTIVTNDFMRNGGDGYEMLATNAIDPYDFGRPIDQVLADYVAANSPLEVELEGRIEILNAE